MTCVPFETAICNHPVAGEVKMYANVGGKRVSHLKNVSRDNYFII